uniref:Uncharacterized protein n=1 Tax=viral metagenome TaxID=1070528 RepID=A0A6C0H6A7_9ZZZZ
MNNIFLGYLLQNNYKEEKYKNMNLYNINENGKLKVLNGYFIKHHYINGINDYCIYNDEIYGVRLHENENPRITKIGSKKYRCKKIVNMDEFNDYGNNWKIWKVKNDYICNEIKRKS